ncbi:MAG: cobyric acid synthase [Hyphomicrobiales bacterium]|nr:cobyric acid synthase [Hyphomicrobiales bacterium]
MLQGTGSDVGKSLIIAGLCRAFTQRGMRVLPFKPQNMSNNAAVTADGGEIGRAQALQARACSIAPHTDMNPVLLKPQSETGAQIIVQGRIFGTARARDYQRLKPRLMEPVLESFESLKARCDLVLVEGAGSAAEVNLRAHDIANMGFASAADVPVVLMGDIDRGGVIAQIVGTRVVMAPDDAARIKGFLVNRFRGDPTLFADGMRLIAERTGWQALGLIPHFSAAGRLPAEDAAGLERGGGHERAGRDKAVTIAIPRLSRLANFDDFDPLAQEPGVDLVFVAPGRPLPVCDLVILPGSKATIADLRFLRAQGWDIDLAAHVRRGGKVAGICAGMQMLGRAVSDPNGMEGVAETVPGLGLLDLATELTGSKRLEAVEGVSLADGAAFRGYEMHIGISTGPAMAQPWLQMNDGRLDGARSADDLIRGCYVHGLFNDDAQRTALLGWIGVSSSLAYEANVEATLDALAQHLEACIDLDGLLALAR